MTAAQPELTKDWYWPSEVAAICRVSTKTVYNWIERGTVKTILRIRPYKIPREEIAKLVNLSQENTV